MMAMSMSGSGLETLPGDLVEAISVLGISVLIDVSIVVALQVMLVTMRGVAQVGGTVMSMMMGGQVVNNRLK